MLIQATYSSERQRLQHCMQSEKEGVKQQLMASMRELARTQELNSSPQQRISTLNKELTRKQLSKAQQSSAKTTTIQKSVKLSQQEIEWLQKSVSSERQRYIHNTGRKATAGQNSAGGEQERDLREQSRTHRAETGKTFQDQYLYIIQIEIHLFYCNCLNISYINYI